MKVAQVLVLEEPVFILFQLLSKIDQLLVVDPEIQQIPSNIVQFLRIGLYLAPEDRFFDTVEPLLHGFQQGQILGDDRLQQVVQEPLQARQPPFLGAADQIHLLGDVAVVIHQRQPVFIQGEGKPIPRAADLLSIRNGEGAGQGVHVHHGLSLPRRIHVHLDVHLDAQLPSEGLPLPTGQDRNEGRALRQGLYRFQGTGRQGFLNDIKHITPRVTIIFAVCFVFTGRSRPQL